MKVTQKKALQFRIKGNKGRKDLRFSSGYILIPRKMYKILNIEIITRNKHMESAANV